jgi:hypothetical protein
MKITRRTAIGLLATTVATEQQAMAQTPTASVTIDWLGNAAPPVATGVSWGVPWPRGTVRRDQQWALRGANNAQLPLQTWPLAYWPDGTLKFSGFATVAGPGPFRLAPGTPAAASAIKVTQSAQAVEIDTGQLQARIAKTGASLIDTLTIDGRVVAREGRLLCALDGGAEFTSDIKKVTVEQTGPVRAVVKIEGVHKNAAREWLPFTVRFYFYAGTTPVRMVHSIVYDGDHAQDFIKGLGVVFAVPMREQVHNRHVRLSGEGEGLWSEPVQPITGRRGLQGASYPDQLAGKRIANKESFNAAGQKLLTDW